MPPRGAQSVPLCALLLLLTVVAALATSNLPLACAANDQPEVTSELRDRAIRTMRDVLQREQRWVKVHAAEFLLALDYRTGVEEAFAEELQAHNSEPEYRIGIWRVLARATYDPQEKRRWIARIRDVFLDQDAPDRLHAVETLAKLGYQVPQVTDSSKQAESERVMFDRVAGRDDAMAVLACWVLANSDPKSGDSRLAELLASPDTRVRGLAAYATGHLPIVSSGTRKALASAAAAEPQSSSSWIHLVCAMTVQGPVDDRNDWKEKLRACAESADSNTRYQACQTLAQIADGNELALLVGRLDDIDADVRSAAAYAVLRVGRRHAMT